MSKKFGIVACGIFKEELEAVCNQLGLTHHKFYLTPGLHVDLDKLKNKLTRKLKQIEDKYQHKVIIYGECHPQIDELAKNHGAERIEVRNCIDALLGDRKKELEKESNNFYISSGWLTNWQKIFVEGLGWDQTDARMRFGRYDKIILINTGVREISDEEILEFYDYTQTPVETVDVDLEHFKEVILDKLE